jgi:transposase
VQAAHPGTRLCLWTQDESRFGLHTIQRRRLTLRGVKPVCPFEQDFENFWLCGAVQPNTGENFVLELPATDSDCLQIFLDQFAAAHAQDPTEVQVLLMDNGGAHRAKALRWPERVAPVYLPSYCPELNPIERWWRELKDALSNTLYGTLDALRERLDAELAAWNHGPERMCSLTSYPYLINALASLDQS